MSTDKATAEVPVVAWLREGPDGAKSLAWRKTSQWEYAASEDKLVRQSDHLSAMEALRAELADLYAQLAGLEGSRHEAELQVAARDEMLRGAAALRALLEANVASRGVHIDALEGVLRGLASYLSAGGYNAPTVDPAEFDAKIRWGVEEHAKMAVKFACKERDRSAQVADVLCCARLYASAFRDASAGIWTGPDHMEPSKASYMDLESAVKRLAGVE